MAIIQKGDAYALPVIILADGTAITEADVAGVRIGLGTITAIWPDGQLRYDSGVWLLPITQAQSYTLPQGDVYYQAQVQMSSGETLSSPRTKIHIDSSIFRQPWGKRELDTGGSVDASAVTAAVSLHPEGIAAEIQNPGVVYGSGAVKYTPQTLTDEQKRQARENIGAAETDYVLPPATSDKLGGIKADAKTEDDTVPARIDADGKLWVKVPDAPLIVTATNVENNTGTVDYSSSEILAATINAGREVYLRLRMNDFAMVEDIALVLAFGGIFQGHPFFYNIFTTGLVTGAMVAMVEGNQVYVYDAGFATRDDLDMFENTIKPQLLPEVTAADNGKFARVVNGAWAAQSLTNVSEVGA